MISAAPHGRHPSLSLESKRRSASFRAGSGGPLSPNYGFSPDGDTAPDIYRKQAMRIEELEKENKRLAKEASEGERRWKKAEEELEEMREAEDEVAPKSRNTSASPGITGEVEKLVYTFTRMTLTFICANLLTADRDCSFTTTEYPASRTILTRNTTWLITFHISRHPIRLRSRLGLQIIYY